MGREGALASFSALGPSLSSADRGCSRGRHGVDDFRRQISRAAYAQSAAIRNVVQVHARAVLLQLQHVAACNALHRVDRRMARWLLQLHDRVPDDPLPVTQEALAQLLGVRRTTVTLTMSKLRAAGAVPSDRRGVLWRSIGRSSGRVTCDCYALMQRNIDRICCQELSAPQPSPHPPFRPSAVVASDGTGNESRAVSRAGK